MTMNMNSGQFPGVPVAPEVSEHANNTLQGIINIAAMRRDQAADNVTRIEQAIAALDFLAQQLIDTRAYYMAQYQQEEQNIAQYYSFATGQAVPSVAPQMTVPAPQNGTPQFQGQPPPLQMPPPMQMQAPQQPVQPQLPPQYVQQPAGLQPVPQAGPFGAPLRPMAPIDLRPDAEGRRPVGVAQLTPELRQAWKETPPVTVEVFKPGEPGYVGPNQVRVPLPIPVVAVPDDQMPNAGAPSSVVPQVIAASPNPATPPASDPPTS